MDGMKTRGWLAALVFAAAAVLTTVACSGGGAGEDKAGGSGKPVVLRLADTSSQLNVQPAVADFVQRVEELSGGDVRIKVVDQWADFASDAEQQVVRDVATHDVDLGWVGTRVFDTLGVRSFEALTAPMLINSYALENAVIERGITEQMMKGLDDLGVVGLGILPDGLRKPVGVKRPIVGPSDWRGITFGTLRSKGQAEAIRALGATPAQVFGTERKERIERGTVQGFEMSLWTYQANVMQPLAPYVTANVNLWPQMDVLIANPARLAALTAKQRGWLNQAARDAAAGSSALADKDRQTIAGDCRSGARFAEASEADLAGLEAAFAPVYANLEKDPTTKAFIERISALKKSTAPGETISIPRTCTGKAPERAAGRSASAPAKLDGSYRYVITLDEARKAGPVDPENVYPQVTTITLKDGRVDNIQKGCFGAGATYSVEGDRIIFDSVEYGYTMTFTFSRDGRGNLHLTPVPPFDSGDAFQCSSQPWTKIR